MPMTNGIPTITLRREVLIKARLRKGWNKADLARAANVPANAITRVENNGPVGPRLLRRLVTALELDLDDVVTITTMVSKN